MTGHDFWLTRCGHGVGFWSRGLGRLGEKLTHLAEQTGDVDLYVGDCGLVYQCYSRIALIFNRKTKGKD